MTVKEFVTSYNAAKTSAAKDAIIKKLNVKDYVDVNTKRTYISLVVAKANAEYDSDGKIVGSRYNSVMQHVLFTVTMVQMYTDLDIDFKRENDPDNITEVYDLLTKSGLIDKIVELIGEKEFSECMLFLGMESNDFAQNEMSLQAYVGEKIQRLMDLISALSSPVIDEIKDKFKDINPEDLKKLIDELKNVN
jgi:hypothetical protein